MDEEAGFLSAIHQTPAEDTVRFAYADWLGERDEPHHAPKAEFVRLELRLAHAPDDDPVHLARCKACSTCGVVVLVETTGAGVGGAAIAVRS